MNRSMRNFVMMMVVGVLLALPLITFGQHESRAVAAAENAAEHTAARAMGEAGVHEEGTPSLIKAPREAMITAIPAVKPGSRGLA